MTHLDRLLLATDGSACAEQARRHALYVAHRFDAAVHVVHVDEREVELSDVIDIQEADVLTDLRLPNNGDSWTAGPRVQERRVVHPSAAGGLLAYATEHDMHLLVLGTHGRRGPRRLLGSVTEEVVRRTPCPLLTVRRDAPAPEALHEGHLLVPVDFSDHQASLLAHARELARAYAMTLTLLHVVQRQAVPAAYGAPSQPAPHVLAERSADALTEQASRLREDGLDVRTEVRTGAPFLEIIDVADDLPADLLTIASHGQSSDDGVLVGSVAERVVRRAPCPVFTVKSFGPSLV